MNSDNGYEKTGLLKTQGILQIPSNVTRISRCFKRRCSDGKLQIISYESGVGTGSNTLDSITGGAFGLGLSEVGSLQSQRVALITINTNQFASEFAKLIHISAQTTWTETTSSWLVSLVVPSQLDQWPAWLRLSAS